MKYSYLTIRILQLYCPWWLSLSAGSFHNRLPHSLLRSLDLAHGLTSAHERTESCCAGEYHSFGSRFWPLGFEITSFLFHRIPKKCVLFSHSLGEESAVRVNRIFLLHCTCPVLHHWERMLVFCTVVLNTACGNRYINTEPDTLTSQMQPLTFSEVVLLRWRKCNWAYPDASPSIALSRLPFFM